MTSELEGTLGEPVNYERLGEMSDGQVAGMTELAEMYVAAMQDNLKKMHEAIRSQDCEAVEHVAHSAVGASGLIGMMAVIPSLRKIETLGEQAKLAEIPAALAEFESAYASVLSSLENRKIISSTPRR